MPELRRAQDRAPARIRIEDGVVHRGAAAIFVLVTLLARALPAAQVTTLIEQSDSASRSATLRARRVDGTAEPIECSLSIPGTGVVTLPSGLWEVRLTGPDIWARPLYVRNQDSATIELLPAVRLIGTSNLVPALRVQFSASSADGESGDADCTIARDSWQCVIPPGRYDLRFSSPGFAPEFKFGISVDRASPPTFRLNFVPGASLSGRVEPVRGSKISPEGASVILTASSAERDIARQVATVDAKGFFQFKGLAPGDYSIHAQQRGMTARSESVRVLAGVAAALNTPLLLDTPKRLTVTVVPRVDPDGLPWRVQLLATNEPSRRADVVTQSSTSAAGEWTHPGLVAGNYAIELQTSAGGRWKSEEVVIEHDDVNVVIAGIASKISGKVTLGGHPLPASLTFGGEWGVKLLSGDDGGFAGNVPPDDADTRTVLVEADAPRVKRTIRARVKRLEGNELRLDIELPATTLMGRVVDADHAPAPHSIVTIKRNDPDTFEQTFTDEDGGFQISGFEPGDYKVTAQAFQRTSRSMPVTMHKDSFAEVELVLEKYEHVRGRITVGDLPVVGADIYAVPRDGSGATIPHATTNESGYFELDFPPGTTTFDGLAIHPAFDTVFGRATIQRDKQMHIPAQQMGGTLMVASKSVDDLVLLHNGAEMHARWFLYEGGATVTPGRVMLPRLQPGHYSACIMNKTKCVTGDLAPHGMLTLSLNGDD